MCRVVAFLAVVVDWDAVCVAFAGDDAAGVEVLDGEVPPHPAIATAAAIVPSSVRFIVPALI